MITITFYTWMIPIIVTVGSLIWAIFIVNDGNGYGAGLSNIFALIPALGISCIAWMLYGFFK